MERLVGKKAPHFEMETAEGNGVDFGKVNLDDYKGKWLVLFFYPLDFTFVCPTEITGLSEYADHFKKLDTEILGVSTDSIHSHKAWINTPVENNGLSQLNFPLASDNLHQVSKDYGVYLEDEGVALRGLYIIDPDGVVRYQVIHDNDIGRSVEETLRVLQALQAGGLCPANWRPGQELLSV